MTTCKLQSVLQQKEEADALESDTYAALVTTPDRGADFAAAVRSVLADETHWVAWKRDTAPDAAGRMVTCGSFQRPPYQEPATLQKGRGKRPGGKSTRKTAVGAKPRTCPVLHTSSALCMRFCVGKRVQWSLQ